VADFAGWMMTEAALRGRPSRVRGRGRGPRRLRASLGCALGGGCEKTVTAN
jgi:hypothetical protein